MGKSIPPTKSSKKQKKTPAPAPERTAARPAPPAATPATSAYERHELVGLSDIRRFFIRNTEPVFQRDAT